jgi:hypothetical protein
MDSRGPTKSCRREDSSGDDWTNLVTQAGGIVGSGVAERYSTEGAHVIALDNLSQLATLKWAWEVAIARSETRKA